MDFKIKKNKKSHHNGFFNITKVESYEILDSRGNPTVCTKVYAGEIFAKAMIPSGASTGAKEAVELRDKDPHRYFGKGVLNAVKNVNDIIGPKLIGKNCNEQKEIDHLMIDLDGTMNKAKLGANAILSVSLAVAKLAAMLNQKELFRYIAENLLQKSDSVYTLPVPMLNVINGGVHADNTIDFQEFMFMPIGAKTMHHAIRVSSECFHALEKILKAKKMNINKGDEGGFAPDLKKAEDALTLMVQAIKDAGYEPGIKADVAIALDPAASEFYDDSSKSYVFSKLLNAKILDKASATKTSDQMVNYYISLVKKFPIISIEDGLSETDHNGFKLMVEKLGKQIQIVGDDLFCTNPKLVLDGIAHSYANSVLVKVNQIGTLSETLETIKLAHNANWTSVISHRSGETEDTYIADIAVATGCGQIKTGSMSRSERIAKYNRLIEIEKILGTNATYPGLKAFKYNL